MSVTLETLERLKQQLKEARNQGSAVKLDLYTHLTEVFNRIMMHHPYDAFEKFEEISQLVKQTHLKIKDPAYDFEVNQIQFQQNNPEKAVFLQKCINLIREINDIIPKEDKALISRNKAFAIPNIMEEARLFEWAGVGFGEEKTFMISKAIKRLAQLSGASQMRFWGKIYGSVKDYWVIEGVLDQLEEEKLDFTQEKRGEGVNKMVYWVTDNILEDWVQLPDAKPEHLVGARLIKHIFTGNLNASIDSNPPFPGKERHFLRAQLSRITHATVLIPKGLLEVDEETNQEKFTEDFTVPGMDELKSLETWAHRHFNILKAGRISHQEPQGLPDEEKDEIMNKLNETDPILDKYRAINEDQPMTGMENPPWLSKLVGDTQPYNQLPPKEGTVSYAVNVIKSLRWPGALTVAQNGRFQSIYVGYGLKRGDVCFNPTEPPDLQKDPNEQNEQPEPTPLIPPEEPLEPLTEAEGKNNEEEEAD